MKGSSSIISGMYQVCEWIMRFSVVNMLWIFFNLPIVLIVRSMFIAEQTEDVLILSLPLSILVPLLFFPATAAMFASVRGWVIKQDKESLIKRFWNDYKENYKKSVRSGVCLTAIWGVWVADYYYLSEGNPILLFTFIILGFILFAYTINFFSIHAHYDMKVSSLFKKTLIMTFGSPILLMTVILSNGILIYISMNGPVFLIVFFTGTLAAFLSFSAFYRQYLKLIDIRE